jgi:MFS family permease
LAIQRARWDRSIAALLLAVFCSAAASLVCVTALGVQVYDLTHRELDLGLLGLAEFAPSALLILVVGSIVDRFRRVRISAISAAVQATAAGGLAAYAATNPTSATPIFALVILFGAARAFLAPSNRSLPADVVSADRLPWLTARRAAAWQWAVIAGPIAAGFLYEADPVLPYIAGAALLAIASVSSLLIKTRESDRLDAAEAEVDVIEEVADKSGVPAPRTSRLREAVEGLAYIRRSPILLGVISLDLFAVLFGGAVALLPAIAEDRLHVGSVGLGWLRAAGGIGAVLVTLIITRRPVTRRVGPVLLLSIATFGIATIVLGATPIYALAFIAMAVLSGADSISVFIRSTLVPLVTPRSKRGRVMAVESVFIGASNELGAFESGVVGQLIGAPLAIVTGGAATLAIAGLYWVRFPALREVDRFPDRVERGAD